MTTRRDLILNTTPHTTCASQRALRCCSWIASRRVLLVRGDIQSCGERQSSVKSALNKLGFEGEADSPEREQVLCRTGRNRASCGYRMIHSLTRPAVEDEQEEVICHSHRYPHVWHRPVSAGTGQLGPMCKGAQWASQHVCPATGVEPRVHQAAGWVH